MAFNNLSSILDCLSEWNRIKDTPALVVEYLGLGNSFSFERATSDTAVIHAYPGISIEDKKFYMFLIDAASDRESTDIALFNAITVCEVMLRISSPSQIPEEEALKRIEEWNSNYDSWATQQIENSEETKGVFQAFNMPSSYMQKNESYVTYFGLKEDSESITNYAADLVTSYQSPAAVSYYDTVRPVPPFNINPLSNFYLLSLI
jgi:hypothetical protein